MGESDWWGSSPPSHCFSKPAPCLLIPIKFWIICHGGMVSWLKGQCLNNLISHRESQDVQRHQRIQYHTKELSTSWTTVTCTNLTWWWVGREDLSVFVVYFIFLKRKYEILSVGGFQ